MEYGNAVLRLRKCKCIMEDVDLFNSYVIKSVNYPGGIDMAVDGNEESVIIVSKNLTTFLRKVSTALPCPILHIIEEKFSWKPQMLQNAKPSPLGMATGYPTMIDALKVKRVGVLGSSSCRHQKSLMKIQ